MHEGKNALDAGPTVLLYLVTRPVYPMLLNAQPPARSGILAVCSQGRPIVAAFIKKHQLVPSHTKPDDSVSLQLELNGDKMESQEHLQWKETTVGNRARMGHTHIHHHHHQGCTSESLAWGRFHARTKPRGPLAPHLGPLEIVRKSSEHPLVDKDDTGTRQWTMP